FVSPLFQRERRIGDDGIERGKVVPGEKCRAAQGVAAHDLEIRRAMQEQVHARDGRGCEVLLLEKNLTTSAIARMNLFLHGASDFKVVRGDTLRSPAFFSGDNLATFDSVIANPPFSLEKWGDEVWSSDPYGRNFAGMPPGKSGDYAW